MIDPHPAGALLVEGHPGGIIKIKQMLKRNDTQF
jgi:hypothetical protein